MTTAINKGRQYVLAVEQAFDYTDLATANLNGALSKVVAKLPKNAIVLDGGILVETAFDGTTPAVDVGDGTTATLYKTAASLAALAYIPFTAGQARSLNGGSVALTPNAGVKVATVGKGRLIVQYIVVDKAIEVQPA
jgi:hypothetical protein